jgi:hypothetical protein
VRVRKERAPMLLDVVELAVLARVSSLEGAIESACCHRPAFRAHGTSTVERRRREEAPLQATSFEQF